MKKSFLGLLLSTALLASPPSHAVLVVSTTNPILVAANVLLGGVNVALALSAVSRGMAGVGVLHIGLAIFALDDSGKIEFVPVNDERAREAGLTVEEQVAVNANIPAINALSSAIVAKAQAGYLSETQGNRSLEQALGANFDETTLSGFNKVRDSIRKKLAENSVRQ